MSSRLWRFFACLLRPSMLVLVLLAAGQLSTAYGIADSVRGLEARLVVMVVLTALMAGWVLSGLIFPAWGSLFMGLLLGNLLLLVRLGQLGSKMAILYWTAWEWITRLQFSFLNGVQEKARISPAWKNLQSSVVSVVTRLTDWAGALLRGEAGVDPLPVAFFWSLALWLVALWAGWSIRKGYSVLAAMLPAMILLGTTLAYGNDHISPLIVLLAITLFATLVLDHIRREAAWQTAQVDFSTEIRLDLALSGIPAVTGLLILALLVPSISIEKIARTVTEWTHEQGVEPERAGQPIGLRPRPGAFPLVDDYRSPGLPRDHLIGSGPELSQEVALVVRTFELPPGPPGITQQSPHRYYWRGVIYDRYTGSGWATTQTREQVYRALEPISDQDPSQYRLQRQEIRRLRSPGDIMFLAGSLGTSTERTTASWRAENDLFTLRSRGETIEVQGWIPNYDRESLREAQGATPEWVTDRFLRLPESVPDRVLGLARDLTASSDTPYDRALAIETYLRTLPYTLDLPAPPGGVDIVDYFLFDLKRGYCDYYASAMVVLARAAGLPARLVIGYATGGYDPQGARYIVTEADAHSWPEIYFPGYGWVEFEPTSSRPLVENPANPLEELTPVPVPLVTPIPGAPAPGQLEQILTWVLPVGMGLLLILLALQPWRYLFTGITGNPARSAQRMERAMAFLAGWLDVTRLPGDTQHEFSSRLSTILQKLNRPSAVRNLDTVTNFIQKSYYAPHQPPPREQSQAESAWHELRTQILLTRLRRLLGFKYQK